MRLALASTRRTFSAASSTRTSLPGRWRRRNLAARSVGSGWSVPHESRPWNQGSVSGQTRPGRRAWGGGGGGGRRKRPRSRQQEEYMGQSDSGDVVAGGTGTERHKALLENGGGAPRQFTHPQTRAQGLSTGRIHDHYPPRPADPSAEQINQTKQSRTKQAHTRTSEAMEAMSEPENPDNRLTMAVTSLDVKLVFPAFFNRFSNRAFRVVTSGSGT